MHKNKERKADYSHGFGVTWIFQVLRIYFFFFSYVLIHNAYSLALLVLLGLLRNIFGIEKSEFDFGSKLLQKVGDASSNFDPRDLPSNVDHGFVHHEELIEALSKGKKSFTSYDVHHLYSEWNDGTRIIHESRVFTRQQGDSLRLEI